MNSFRSTILIVVAVAVLYFYVRPQWSNVSVLKNQNTELVNALNKSKELTELRDKLLLEYKAVPEIDIQKIGRVVPKQYDPVKLVADINAIALKYGMSIKDVNINDSKADAYSSGAIQDKPVEEVYRKVELSFSTKSQYKVFIAFIEDLEKSLQLLDIQKVDISTEKENDKQQFGVNILNFKISLDTYWLN
ncbi:MAG: hypothetical protein ACYCZW_03285 [Minisyncoccota bacterium]